MRTKFGVADFYVVYESMFHDQTLNVSFKLTFVTVEHQMQCFSVNYFLLIMDFIVNSF